MATWFEITFEGEPTEADFERVAELAAQGFTSGQLINAPGTEPASADTIREYHGDLCPECHKIGSHRSACPAAQGFTSGALINHDQPEPEARFIGSRRGKVRDLGDAADRGHAWTMAASPPHPFTGDRASEPYCRACGCGAGGIQHTEG